MATSAEQITAADATPKEKTDWRAISKQVAAKKIDPAKLKPAEYVLSYSDGENDVLAERGELTPAILANTIQDIQAAIRSDSEQAEKQAGNLRLLPTSKVKGKLFLHALAYAKRGWPCFPCGVASKMPLIPESLGGHGSKDATTDEAQIRAWWKKAPNANVALATGHVFFVLDIDPRHGGDETLDSLELTYGKLPDTLVALTPTGGKHYFFRLPDFNVRNSTGKVGRGIDIRGEGGYVLAAPSIHPENRSEYVWDGMNEFHGAIATAPAWLLDKLCDPDHKGPHLVQEKIPHGQQHDALVSEAGAMRRRGWSEEEIYAALVAMNNTRCEIPGPDKNIRRIAHSMMQYPPENMPRHVHIPEDPDAEPAGNPNWRDGLTKSDTGIPIVESHNVIHALTYSPEFAGRIAFDEFAGTICAIKPLPDGIGVTHLKDEHETKLAAFFQREYGFRKLPTQIMREALHVVSREHPVHPVREYLESLKWDGVERINHWLVDYLGAEQNAYVQTVSRRWLISAVARVMKPGCKADHMLILEGRQGLLKSTVSKVLGGEWFTDELPFDSGTKESAIQMAGRWIIEVAELDAFSRSEATRVKAFVSRSTDRYRPHYGRNATDVKRQCVFIGTTNSENYLRDETGARRFWPVKCTAKADLSAVEAARDQLWAEAFNAYQAEEPWWIHESELEELAEEEQAARFDADPWLEIVSNFCADREDVSVSEVLRGDIQGSTVISGIGKAVKDWTQADKNRVARCLKVLGYERYQKRAGNDREWRYRKSKPEFHWLQQNETSSEAI